MSDTTTKESSYVTDELIATDIDAYLVQHQHKSLLRPRGPKPAHACRNLRVPYCGNVPQLARAIRSLPCAGALCAVHFFGINGVC